MTYKDIETMKEIRKWICYIGVPVTVMVLQANSEGKLDPIKQKARSTYDKIFKKNERASDNNS